MEAGRQMEQQHGLGGAGGGSGAAGAGAGAGAGAALLDEQAGPGMDEGAFEALLQQAFRGQTAAVLAAVDQDKRLATRANMHGYGTTLLHWSCNRGHLELAGALLERGADVHAKSSSGGDACYYACYSGNLALVALLLDEGASPHTRPPNSHSCISLAAAKDHLPVVLQLISKGADLFAPTRLKLTALELWGEHKHFRLGPAELASRRTEALAAFRAGPPPRGAAPQGRALRAPRRVHGGGGGLRLSAARGQQPGAVAGPRLARARGGGGRLLAGGAGHGREAPRVPAA